MKLSDRKQVAIIVAHPNDETRWAGGLILSNPTWKIFVVCLCHGTEKDIVPKFYNALKVLNADGIIRNLDQGREHIPINEMEMEEAILSSLPMKHFDLILTHNDTRVLNKNLRHEEITKAVLSLLDTKQLFAKVLWTFGYEKNHNEYLFGGLKKASNYCKLSDEIYQRKYDILTQIYGVETYSSEALTAAKAEAFWQYKNPYKENKILSQFENQIKKCKSFILKSLNPNC